MKISRRNFLGALSASLAAGIPAAGRSGTSGLALSMLGGPTAALPSADALSRLGWTSFYPYLNTQFEFSSLERRRASEVTRLTLSAMVGDEPDGKTSGGTEPGCFVLKFMGRAGTDGPKLFQKTYAVEHFALGRFDLFVSDGDLVDGNYFYTAVINRVTG